MSCRGCIATNTKIVWISIKWQIWQNAVSNSIEQYVNESHLKEPDLSWMVCSELSIRSLISCSTRATTPHIHCYTSVFKTCNPSFLSSCVVATVFFIPSPSVSLPKEKFKVAFIQKKRKIDISSQGVKLEDNVFIDYHRALCSEGGHGYHVK